MANRVSRIAQCVLRAAILSFLCIGLCSADAANANSAKEPTPSWSVHWQPAKPVNGAPILFRVTAPKKLDSLFGKWLDHDVYFFLDPKNDTWYGLAGVSLETKPGTYALHLTGVARSQGFVFERNVIVAKAQYPVISVTVAKKFTEPNPEQMQQIDQEKNLKQDVFHHFEPKREWTGGFLPPVTARVSDVFGTRRVFNGATKSVHEGLDYAVPQGTPVSALNAGTVILAQPLFFEGNCIVLDHGQGLMTLYLHLSEFKVKAGEHVVRGQEIGLSGGTGRATGPHLHIAVRWEGTYLDPATLLKLRLP